MQNICRWYITDTSNTDINNDLVKTSRWAYQWKMSFNPDINKQATKWSFSQRREKSLPPPIIFNNNNVLSFPCQKQLQSCSEYFENFSWLSKFSFHRKWDGAWLLVINWYIRVASWVAERLKVRKYQESLKTS